MTDASTRILLRAGLIMLLIAAVYANTLNHGFVWDDEAIIVESHLTDTLTNIPKFFISEDKTGDAPTGYYRPITYLSFALDRAIWGLNPRGFNLTNLVLHILVALVFFRTVASLFKREDLALAAALIFALHPIAGETINFHAGGRNTLLSALFSLLSLLFYINRKHVPALTCFTLAIFSKEFALLLPVLFFVYDRKICEKEFTWSAYVPYVVAPLCYRGLRSLAVTSHNLFDMLDARKFMLVPQIIVTYLKNLVFPVGLKTIYDISSHVSWASFGLYALVLTLFVGGVLACRRNNELVFAACIFFLFLLPVTNVLPLGVAKMADRHAYFASFGFSLALAYGVCQLKKQFILPVVALVCAFYISIDVQRNGIWKDNDSFFRQVIKDAPERFIGYQGVGYSYYLKGDFERADTFLTEASTKKDIIPFNLVGNAWIFWELNKRDKAMALLDKTIELAPEHFELYIMASRFAEEMGNRELAALYRDKALAVNPRAFAIVRDSAAEACRHGEELMAEHRTSEAERFLRDALHLDPVLVPALIDMGNLLAEKGETAKALALLSKAAVLSPGNPAAHYNLSLVYEALGNKEEARKEMNAFRTLGK